MAVYYILMKPVLKIYPPVTVTAWSYCFGALVMAAVSLMYEYPCPSRKLRKSARAPAQRPPKVLSRLVLCQVRAVVEWVRGAAGPFQALC